MRKLSLVFTIFLLLASVVVLFAQNSPKKIILLISEQNIESPRAAWWASEVDLSATEAAIAGKIIEAGYEVIEPSALEETLKKDKAYRMVDLSETDSAKLGNLSKADFVVLGKAVASAGGNVPQSTMRSCFANVTAKLIRVKDSKVIAYVDATGNSAHPDEITGGKEALVNAADVLSAKIIEELNKQQ